jgi:hypothetical protein
MKIFPLRIFQLPVDDDDVEGPYPHAAVHIPQKIITHKIKYVHNLITEHKSNIELHDHHILLFLFKMLFLVHY